jgi:hypothetical protein
MRGRGTGGVREWKWGGMGIEDSIPGVDERDASPEGATNRVKIQTIDYISIIRPTKKSVKRFFCYKTYRCVKQPLLFNNQCSLHTHCSVISH